jgi:multidrug efflux pump subunit AcrB
MELVVVSSGRPASTGELASLILPAGTGPLRISDAGELGREPGRRKSLFVFNGREGTALEIYRRPGGDPVKLSRDIKKMLAEAGPLFVRDAEIVLVHDSAETIVRGIWNLCISALLGAAAVTGTLIFFIRRVRWGFLAALSIPVSASAGICALAVSGRSLNGMSLSGLAVGIGLVSDTGVIVLDLIHRRFQNQSRRPLPAELGSAAASVAGSSLASTITTAVVFIPVIFLPGPLGSLFGDTSMALVTSIAAGWFYAQFCLPSLYRVFFQHRRDTRTGRAAKLERKLENRYGYFLAAALRHPLRVLSAAVLTSVLGLFLLLSRPTVFISPDEAGEIAVSLVFPPGTLLESAGKGGTTVSRVLAEVPGVQTVFGRAGSEDEDLGRRADTDYRKEELQFHCVLDAGADREKTLEMIRKRMELISEGPELPEFSLPRGTVFSVAFPQDRTERLLGLSSAHTLAIRGAGREETSARIRQAVDQLQKNLGPSLASLQSRPSGARPELRFFPNREAAAFLGVSAAGMAEALYTMTEGVVCSRLEIEGRPLDVRVSGTALSAGPEPELVLEGLPLLTPGGNRVFLGSLGRVERRESEAALARLDRGDVAYLDLLPVSGGGTGFSREIQKAAAGLPWLSRADESVFTRYRTSLFVTLALVLLLLYITMGAQFESFLLPLIFMLAIPFSLAGTGPALFLAGASLDSGAVLGLTVLCGLVVNNGIILYEIGEEKIRAGLSPGGAVFSGARERLCPVLITTITTLLALIPLATAPLGSSQKSMAAAMMGGIISAALLSLFALPPVFIRFFRWRFRP